MASLLTDHNGKKAKNTIVYIGNFKLPGGEAANALMEIILIYLGRTDLYNLINTSFMKIFYAADVIFKDARIGDKILDLHFNMKELNKKYEFSFNIENSEFPPSPFIVACAMGNLNDVKFFYDYYYTNGKMNIEHQKDLLRYEGIGFRYGYTGLMAAAKHDCVDVVKFLIEKGADCSQVCTSNSCNALQWLIDKSDKSLSFTKNSVEICKILLNKMSLKDIHSPERQHDSGGSPTVLDVLLDDFNPNYYCKQIITLFKEKRVPRSFLYAVCQHDVDLVLQMLKNGTDIGSTDEMGRNALHTIGWDGAYFMFELLLNHPSMTEKIINHSSQYEGSPLKCIVDYYPDGLEKTDEHLYFEIDERSSGSSSI